MISTDEMALPSSTALPPVLMPPVLVLLVDVVPLQPKPALRPRISDAAKSD